MTASQEFTKSTTEHMGAAQFNRPPRTAKRHGFSPPFTDLQDIFAIQNTLSGPATSIDANI